ncbi:MAG: energy transducer TonB [Crocinitomicaceae bacterium]
MKLLSFIFFFLISISGFSQKLKSITEDNYDLFCRSEYTVLKKDKTVKHGRYRSVYVNGNPREEGYYHFGKKDSLWTYFHHSKPIMSSRGYYEDGKKVGIWDYFDEKEQSRHRYDHSTGVLYYTTFKDTASSHTVRISSDSILESKVTRPPIFLLGEKAQLRIIRNNIVYPSEAIELNLFGTVNVQFFVNIYGEAIDYKVTQSVGGGCDEEALRVVKLIPNEWIPGIYNNELKEMLVMIPITFVLN